MLARYRLNRAIIEEEFRKRRDLALLIPTKGYTSFLSLSENVWLEL
jgi:hypothetical protein